MGTTTTVTQQAAKKIHICEWCGETIIIGEIYNRYRYFDQGDTGVVKMHDECYKVMQEEAREEGGWLEFSPYSAPRGARE